MMQSLKHSVFVGKNATLKAPRQTNQSKRAATVVVRAHQVDRRAALGLLAGAAALVAAQPSQAAYGESARVFASKATNATGFTPYVGDGFAIAIPSKYLPSAQVDFPGVVLRYEDSGDAVSSVFVLVDSVNASSIEGLGAPDKFLQDRAYLFGESTFTGETTAEGGFLPNKVASLSILDVSEATDNAGKKYYKYEVLSRTADGNEGGRHHLIVAAVSNNKLYLCKFQVGDKRWFRGENKNAQTSVDSFRVA